MKNTMNPLRGDSSLTAQINTVQAKILKELLADGRKKDVEIAKKIGETRDNVKKNLTKMKEMGVITGATIHINYKSFGYKAVAHIIININPHQADQLIEYLQKMPETYAVYSSGVKGTVDVITTIKTLEQLNEIKDRIKRHFLVLETRTAIWTDVKEMNDNLAIIDENRKTLLENSNIEMKSHKPSSSQSLVDQIDQKIADKLAEDGRISFETLGEKIGISSQVAKRRYERLKKNGALKVTIQVNPGKIGYQALCIFFTVTSHENSFSIIDRISKIPDIISIMKTTGDYDLQIYAMVQDINQLLSIQEELGKVQGIIKMDTEISRLDKWEKWPSPRQYISTF